MDSPSEAAARVAAIDALQDEVLQRLEELEKQCEAVLASCQGFSGKPTVRPLPSFESEPNQRRRAA